MKYLALLRGINVGGRSLIKMADLRACFETSGFQDVSTYIQSGNVIFSAVAPSSKQELKQRIETALQEQFGMSILVAVFTHHDWQTIVQQAPKWWGERQDWKHNLLIMLDPVPVDRVLAGIGSIKPDIESIEAGNGVLYQSMSLKLFGRTTTGKLASQPIYKQMTIRNYNTTKKLLALLETDRS